MVGVDVGDGCGWRSTGSKPNPLPGLIVLGIIIKCVMFIFMILLLC